MGDADCQMTSKLDFTGERYLPEVGGVIELEHLHRYALARNLVSGKDVLDIASGEGYGSYILASTARSVIGVDIAQQAIDHARERYIKDNLSFRQGSCAQIPLADCSVDVVISFETIEHHDEHREMMDEIQRVLRPGGLLIISSPDKAWYTDETGYNNPYHVKELYREEFLDLLRTKFSDVRVYGQRVVYGSAILAEGQCGKAGTVDLADPLAPAANGVARPLYLIALASNGSVPELSSGILEQPFYESEPFRLLAKQYDEKIAGMQAEHQQAERDLQNALDRMQAEVSTHEQQLAHEVRRIAELQGEIALLKEALTKSAESLNWAENEIGRLRRIESSIPVQVLRLPGRAARRLMRSRLASPLVQGANKLRQRVALSSQWKTLKQCPLFDPQWYLEKNPDVRQAGADPLRHYLSVGWREGRIAGPEFDDQYYIARYPDLKGAGMAPLWHYWMYGRYEGRHPNPALDPAWAGESRHTVLGSGDSASAFENELALSVIIPTYNRSAMLPGVLDAWRRVHAATPFKYEIIFSDDGSEDESVELLERCNDLPIRVLRNNHGGASNARNAAIRAARGERLLIIGDDIFPDPMILNVHAEYGRRYGPKTAVLGVVDWHRELDVNHLMKHITDIGNEQFSFNRLRDGDFVDFRHFYTCNISVDRAFIVQEDVLFDEAFHKYGFEDIELGYRLSLRGMRIVYTTEAKGDHYHPYSVAGFCRRQASAGEMAVLFRDMHAAVGTMLGIDPLERDYGRFRPSPDAGVELWESRRDWLVRRCEFYESVLRGLPPVPAQYVKECLSEIYSRLFRAMYEFGVLSTTVRKPDVLCFAMSRNFPRQWAQLWELMGTVDGVSEQEARDALVAFAFRKPDVPQTAAIADLRRIQQCMAVAGAASQARKSVRYLASRALHYLRHDPGYLATRVGGMLASRLRAGSTVEVSTAATAAQQSVRLVVVLPDANADTMALQHQYRPVFGDGVRFVVGLLEPDSNESALFYRPDSVAGALSADHLLTACLAASSADLDIALVSYSLHDDGTATCTSLRNNAVISSRLLSQMQRAGGTVAPDLRGKIVRMVPAVLPAGARLCQLAELLGQDVSFEAGGDLYFRVGRPRQPGQARFPQVAIAGAHKPVVLVLPVFLAVGGVERNTVEVMRQLADRYDFVVVTTERLRMEQGSLAAQAAEVARHVIELSEAMPHAQYLVALEWLRQQIRPALVWICNGSPWLCDHVGHLRGVFSDVPIVDQKAYDANVGWIVRYADEATKTLDRFIAINKKIYNRFVTDFGLQRSRVDLIYSAIDTAKFAAAKRTSREPSQIRAKYGLPPARRTFAFMGRLVTQKRPLQFLELARQRKGRDELYVLVGDGELAADAASYIETHALDNVVRIPYVADTPEFFSVIDGLVITSEYEGLPIAMLEAMAMGVPVLATDVGDIADVLRDYRAGEVVDGNTPQPSALLAQRMDSWLQHLEEYKKNLAEAEAALLDRFSSRCIAAQYEACWSAALSPYAGAQRG